MRELTVGDLAVMLEGVDRNMKVHISYDYGDHWHSQVAPAAREAEEGNVRYSEYHRMDRVDHDSDDESGGKKVFIIR